MSSSVALDRLTLRDAPLTALACLRAYPALTVLGLATMLGLKGDMGRARREMKAAQDRIARERLTPADMAERGEKLLRRRCRAVWRVACQETDMVAVEVPDASGRRKSAPIDADDDHAVRYLPTFRYAALKSEAPADVGRVPGVGCNKPVVTSAAAG